MWPSKRKRETTPKPPQKKPKPPAQIQTKLDLFNPKSRPEPGPPPGIFLNREVRVVCWNINGLRACLQKEEFLKFIQQKDIDVLGLNETKLQDANIPEIKPVLLPFYPFQYYSCSQDRKGYSGVGILSKSKPLKVTHGLGLPDLDQEGRLITAEFDQFRLVVVYAPSSGYGLQRLRYRVDQWDRAFSVFLAGLEHLGKPLIVMGDMNVVHRDIDICERDKHIRDIPGTAYEERNSFTNILGSSLIDTFRYLHPTEARFTWFKNETDWGKNAGWRLDYALISEAFVRRLRSAEIYEKVRASDHHPVEVRIENLWN